MRGIVWVIMTVCQRSLAHRVALVFLQMQNEEERDLIPSIAVAIAVAIVLTPARCAVMNK